MKKIILAFLFILTVSLLSVHPAGRNFQPRVAFTNSLAGAGGGSCTPATGNITNESWEGADSLTWTDTGTVDRNAALSGGSPCSGLGSQCLEVNWDGTGTAQSSEFDRGSNLTTSTLYYRFYFNVISHSMADNDHYTIFQVGENQNPLLGSQFRFVINKVSGQLKVTGVTASSASGTIDISNAIWYRGEVKYVNNTVGQSEVKVFNASSGSQIGTTQTWDTGDNWIRYVHVGLPFTDDAFAMRVQIDGFGMSDVGYLGQ